ncbi:hypothetical protein [Sphingomonas melonis]
MTGRASAVAARVTPRYPAVPETSVALAHATLQQGARHIAGLAPWADPMVEGPRAAVRARYVGNCLRELDRFLGVLLDVSCLAPRPRLLTLKPDTATRIAVYETDGWDIRPAQRRLRALERSRLCLFHDAGRVGCGDVPQAGWLTSGWRDAGSPDLRRYAIGARLRPSALHLHDIAGFYAGLGDRIVSGAPDS